jgi:hypothetical protein
LGLLRDRKICRRGLYRLRSQKKPGKKALSDLGCCTEVARD